MSAEPEQQADEPQVVEETDLDEVAGAGNRHPTNILSNGDHYSSASLKDL